METSGALHMELVDHVFSKYCQQGLNKEDILSMMEQFGLIVKFVTPPTNEKYYVPCQLKTPPKFLCEMILSPSDPCPLYLNFKWGLCLTVFFSSSCHDVLDGTLRMVTKKIQIFSMGLPGFSLGSIPVTSLFSYAGKHSSRSS